MSTPLRSVVLAGGGTGGHIEPALALAPCLGTPKGLEAELIPARGWDLELIPAYPLPRRPGGDLLRTPGRIWRSVAAVRQVLEQVEADALVGFGGYVALPGYLGAWRAKLPLVVHEVNNPAGLANRLGARVASAVGLGSPGVELRGGRVVGVPLRPAISGLDRAARRHEARAHFGLEPERPTLLIFGGSQGARSLNLAAAGASRVFRAAGTQVLHVIGARNSSEGLVFPESVPGEPPYVTVPFEERMELAYAAADVALCRAGALTCAELAAVGLPAIYVPLPWGNGEQRRNALPVVEAGGGLLIEDEELTPETLAENVLLLLAESPDALARSQAMSLAAASFGRRDGDEALRGLLLEAVASRAADGRPTQESAR
jgi:UDP-N-acetylglucosamine--N-acetylmuramyl-(pentapeptide) pyrophosphoryl-undecaprenol N-acetylglucosamine transferase